MHRHYTGSCVWRPENLLKTGPISCFDSLLGTGEEIHAGQLPEHSAANNTSGNPTPPRLRGAAADSSRHPQEALRNGAGVEGLCCVWLHPFNVGEFVLGLAAERLQDVGPRKGGSHRCDRIHNFRLPSLGPYSPQGVQRNQGLTCSSEDLHHAGVHGKPVHKSPHEPLANGIQ
ncbi:hypothetical protein MRX96_007151 [Rhipicephalus microplus]